jgi:hypothetical protein
MIELNLRLTEQWSLCYILSVRPISNYALSAQGAQRENITGHVYVGPYTRDYSTDFDEIWYEAEILIIDFHKNGVSHRNLLYDVTCRAL